MKHTRTVKFEMDETKKCENICACYSCKNAVDAGGDCTNCEECVAREKCVKECDKDITTP